MSNKWDGELVVASPKPLTAVEIRAQVNLIQEVMQAVMKKDTHFGTIPGCKKPSLWKPGAEVLFATFRISVDPVVEDLSSEEEARFRVTAKAHNHGEPLGSAVGEASSDEEKYKWREMVCQEEFDATPEDRRRDKWKHGRNGPYCVQQVRTEVADHRNTILKMAAKRAYVALALQVTAASDIFTQDIEDLPTELQDAAINGDAADQPEPLPTEIRRKDGPHSMAEFERKAAAAPQMRNEPANENAGPHAPLPPRSQAAAVPNQPRPPIQQPRAPQVRIISEAQARRFYAIRKQQDRSDEETREFLQSVCGVTDDRQMPASLYERACKWAETGEDF